jgi:NADH-quinone oxidoreductase subunit G
MFHDKAEEKATFFKDIPEAFKQRNDKWLLLPQYHVLGSGELSIYTKAIEELSPQPFVTISAADAVQLNVNNGDMLKLSGFNKMYLLPVKVQEDMVSGVALISASLRGAEVMNWGAWAKMEKASSE